MTLQVRLYDERLGAELAREAPFVPVPQQVLVEARLLGERAGAQVTLEGPLSGVHGADVVPQRLVQAERPSAVRAVERLPIGVHQ